MVNEFAAGSAFFLAFVLVAALLILGVGAMVLRMACRLVGEEPPDFGKAVLIVLAAGFAQSLIGGVITSAVDAQAINLLVSGAVSSFIYSKMLPTDIGKAALIWLAQIVVAIVLAVIVFVGVVVLGFGAGSVV
jgi:hypothetical protein